MLTVEHATATVATSTAVWGNVLTIVAIAGMGVINHFKGRHKDRSASTQSSALDRKIGLLSTTLEVRLSDIDRNVAEVRAFCVGPDGENGLRADVREIKARVIGLEERERERLSEDRLHGPLDRRS